MTCRITLRFALEVVTAVALVLAALLTTALPAAAAIFEFPAGVACDFPVHGAGDQRYRN